MTNKTVNPKDKDSAKKSNSFDNDQKNEDKVENKKDNFGTKIKQIWKKIGPGLITGASDDDPAGITTYSQAGSIFGLNTLWTAIFTFPLMSAIQEMCGRIGLVQRQGIIAVIKKYYSKKLVYLVALITIPACILNIAADLSGMGAVANMLVPNVNSSIFAAIFAILICLFMIFLPYKKLEKILKWSAFGLLVYLIVPFLVKQDWLNIIKSAVLPQIQFNKQFLTILVAILGTTISPYLFIWEASMEKEELLEEERNNNLPIQDEENLHKEIKMMRKDNLFGMFFSNLIMFFIILTAGTILFGKVGEIQTVEQAARALEPIAGQNAYLLFAIGVIGTGFLAIPVLGGACAYILADLFEFEGNINSKFREASKFYLGLILSILIGFLITLLGFNPIDILVGSSVIYGIVSPILILFLLFICNNSRIMGKFTNGKLANTLGITCFVLMTVCAVSLLFVGL